MGHHYGRMARVALAPKAVILGLATFQFGWALTAHVLRAGEYPPDRTLFLFLSFALLLASVCVTINGERSRLAAAFLCSPVPLFHALIFWSPRPDSDVPFFSVEHIRMWLEELAKTDTYSWVLTVVSFAILISVAVPALHSSAKPRNTSRA
ncbi:MAG: hypothetical protein ACJ741_11830 [Pyrinomonadaceae bacterium]